MERSAENEGAGRRIRSSSLQRPRHVGRTLFNSNSWLSCLYLERGPLKK